MAGHTPESAPREHPASRQASCTRSQASGRYRAVICSTAGRVAPLAAWAGARRARVPLILWASLWAHPRSVAHTLSYPVLRRLYRSADAVVTYGPHVSAYVRSHGAKRVHVAPQAADNAFWSSADVSLPNDPRWPANVEVTFLFAGRPTTGKGTGGARGGLEYVGPAGTNRRARPRRRGIHPPLGPGRRRGGGPGPGPPGAIAQLLRCRRRSGGAVDSDAHLSRAVGAGGERGHEPWTSRNRKRRCRGRRRGARARLAATVSSYPRASPWRWPPHSESSPATQACAHAWGRLLART